jgi:maleate cis-trans isomerase
MTPDEVFELTKKNLAAVDKVDAIYFQGAVLDPIKVLEKIETEIKATVIASNPAMFWYVASELGMKFPRNGYGRLLRDCRSVADILSTLKKLQHKLCHVFRSEFV